MPRKKELIVDAIKTVPGQAHMYQAVASVVVAETARASFSIHENRSITFSAYPRVSALSIAIPIVSWIITFPIFALIIICCLRRRAKLARARQRRGNNASSDSSRRRLSSPKAASTAELPTAGLLSKRGIKEGFSALELKPVMEEHNSDLEQTETELLTPETPLEVSYKLSFKV